MKKNNVFSVFVKSKSFPLIVILLVMAVITMVISSGVTEGAPFSAVSAWEKRYAWYDLRGYPLLVFPLDDCTQMAWYSPESR